ncbi:hypothetical protein BGX38DRAFT_1274133 [Terfezia claveryi]|nr:hypothetical protein BGX38DRAFT_1274133 [Terfezia claveryi]
MGTPPCRRNGRAKINLGKADPLCPQLTTRLPSRAAPTPRHTNLTPSHGSSPTPFPLTTSEELEPYTDALTQINDLSYAYTKNPGFDFTEAPWYSRPEVGKILTEPPNSAVKLQDERRNNQEPTGSPSQDGKGRQRSCRRLPTDGHPAPGDHPEPQEELDDLRRAPAPPRTTFADKPEPPRPPRKSIRTQLSAGDLTLESSRASGWLVMRPLRSRTRSRPSALPISPPQTKRPYGDLSVYEEERTCPSNAKTGKSRPMQISKARV